MRSLHARGRAVKFPARGLLRSATMTPMFAARHPVLFVTYKLARRIAVALAGFTVLAIGIVMIVTPGPAIVVIPIGLGILGLEFAWARHWLAKIRERGALVMNTIRGGGSK
jgi:tellurite resistance protein TerC